MVKRSLQASLSGIQQAKRAINQSADFAHAHLCGNALSNILGTVLDAGFQKALQQLQDQFPHLEQSQERFQSWWQEHHVAWSEQLKSTIAQYRQINHCWKFNSEQEQTLQRYYAANQLLLDCLHSNCEVTATIRAEIETILLLPQRELEAREWQ